MNRPIHLDMFNSLDLSKRRKAAWSHDASDDAESAQDTFDRQTGSFKRSDNFGIHRAAPQVHDDSDVAGDHLATSFSRSARLLCSYPPTRHRASSLHQTRET